MYHLPGMAVSTNRPFIINGVLQHYDWGGFDYLPKLLGEPNPDRTPTAELWMGTHPKGPATIPGTDETLAGAIEQCPVDMLGEDVAYRFDRKLPFLFKVLDVREMLSIQVHPNKEGARAGFAREEANGPERSAPDRNYRDDNHKPELGVALTDFYLLHGFRSLSFIHQMCEYIPGWGELVPVLKRGGVSGLYRHVMEADQTEVDRLLQPLVDGLGPTPKQGRAYPEFWAHRAVELYSKNDHHDRGLFSIFWFNIVHLRPGEGIFQDAGIPHAYLEGTCIELMANSDNVLRGGLTPKHIDVPELMKHIVFDEVTPRIIRPALAEHDGEWVPYPTPAPDFALSVARAHRDDDLVVDTRRGPAILFLHKGSVASGEYDLTLDRRRRIAFVPAGLRFALTAHAATTLYLAEVGQEQEDYVPLGMGHHVSDH